MKGIEFVLDYKPWYLAVQMWVRTRVGDSRFVAEPVNLRALTEGDEGAYMEPTLTFDGAAAQQLMDELWRIGIRPSQSVEGSAAALDAMRMHLADMRRLVFEAKGE